MANEELLFSLGDAAVVASLHLRRHTLDPNEALAAEELADAFAEAAAVPDERLPLDRVSMGSSVSYVEEPGGARRNVSIVHPRRADPARGRISVLSPVGRALLGRRRGSVVRVEVPGAPRLALRIVSIEPVELEESS